MLLIDILKTIKHSLNKTLKKNVFHTSYNKSVLISFVTDIFNKNKEFSHTAYDECLSAAEVFNELGYRVDIVDLFSKENIDYSKYDIIYGQGFNLERSFLNNTKAKRIYYANGSNTIFSNLETLKKIKDFKEKNGGLAIESGRITWYTQDLQFLLSDKVIVLGNDFTKSTYQRFSTNDNRFENLKGFFYNRVKFDIKQRDFDVSRNHFVWFGSLGALHKGLDTTIDYFLEHSEYTLHVCGKPERETVFWNTYSEKIQKSNNIVLHGFINITSQEFIELLEKCCYAIYPSVSEGCCGALLTVCGVGGLIPITSVRSGVDFPNEVKISKDVCIKDIEETVNFYKNKTNEELQNLSNSIKQYISENYTLDKYKENLGRIIKNICLD